jgi:hypothetical protein
VSTHRWTVATEGGPLLIGDLTNISAWRGVDDYAAALDTLDDGKPGRSVPVGEGVAVLWDIPTGVATVARHSRVRVLLEAPMRAGRRPSVSDFGVIDVGSGWLGILWAAESGSDLATADPEDEGQPTLAVGGSSLIVQVQPGQYSTTCHEADRRSIVVLERAED